MVVYVINKHNKPLMPCSATKARKLLKLHKATVVRRTPFTIKLIYGSSGYKQPITLGVDAGSKHIGLSATTEAKELYASVVELRHDIVDLLSTRRENRRTRRNKLRYRKPRFNNRVKSKKNGWLAPSIRQRIDSHLKVVEDIHKILPVSKIIVETASFDIQKINNPDISGSEYQEGEQLGFWNVREYVLWRDNYTCQCCKGKSKDKILNVHHIESRKTGGNSPKNLITLCKTCHSKYHRGEVKLNLKKHQSFRDAAFMGIMRWTFYNKLKEIYKNVGMTYGYITKSVRILHNLPKEHYVDARCISKNPTAESLGYYFFQKKIRCHNRQTHKSKILKGGIRKRNQSSYILHNFRLYDKVKFDGKECFIWGRRSSGYFLLKDLSGNTIHSSAKYSNLKFIETRHNYIMERRR